MLTDRQWALLGPLIEVCRPHRKARHHDLRRTIEAIFWRCQNGAKERLLALAQEQGMQLGMTFLDGTSIHAHEKAAGAAKGVGLLARLPAMPCWVVADRGHASHAFWEHI